jgi:hypothetical protein
VDEREIRLRLIEAAAAHPTPHDKGFAAGTLDTARLWEEYVLTNTKISGPSAPSGKTLGLPKKG